MKSLVNGEVVMDEFVRLTVTGFDPIRGHPGCTLVIEGAGFSSDRAGNHVIIGGAPALIVEASHNRLSVISSNDTTTGPVEVEVDGRNGVGPVDFEALAYPGGRADGPPILFAGRGDGAQQGAPSTGTLHVLAVLCNPSNLTPPNAASVRNSVIAAFAHVHTFYNQVSYGSLDVAVDVTPNWRSLDGTAAELISGDNFAEGKLPQIMAEAAQQGKDDGFNLDNYSLIAAVVYTNQYTNQTIRCWGGGKPYTNFKYKNPSGTIDINITVKNPIQPVWINETADWGRCAHEVGHCIVNAPGNLSAWQGAEVLDSDVYGSDLVDPQSATAEPFDLMGAHDSHPMFSAYYMEQLAYYKPTNIRLETWDRNPFSKTFELVAHGDTQNTLANRYHLLRIEVSKGLYYYIEVRQRPDAKAVTPAVYDENIPLGTAANQGGVVVTKVLTGQVNMNQQMRFITLLHDQVVLHKGQVATDPARYLKITVEDDNVVARPLTCRVRVEWAKVVGDTPGGDFDLRVEPMNSNCESPDIWIDRLPYGTFDYVDPATGDPTGNGDKPQPRKPNKFIGRVHCDGKVDATNVSLTFYSVTPPGVGDNGNWGPLGPPKIIPSITKQASAEAEIIWVPEVGEHTCLKIFAGTQAGEINAGGNNWTQENIFYFEASSSSVPAPVVINIAVRNPLDVKTLAFISVRNVPKGFTVQFPHSWVWLEARQERRFDLIVVPTEEYYVYSRFEMDHADIIVDGWVPRQYEEEWGRGIHPASTFRPMGGILTRVTPKRTVNIELGLDPEYHDPAAIGITGRLTPAMASEVITIEMLDPTDQQQAVRVGTDHAGRFNAHFDLPVSTDPAGGTGVQRGVYVLTAYVFNSPHAADTEPKKLYVTR